VTTPRLAVATVTEKRRNGWKENLRGLLVSVAVLSNERLQNIENLFLLTPRQFGNRLEKLASFADRFCCGLTRWASAKKFVGRNIKNLCELHQDI